MRRVFLTRAEKEEVLKILEAWDASALSPTTLQQVQDATGIPATLVETALLLYDSLLQLSKFPQPHAVLKGGIAIQTYTPPSFQRASVDLDLNSHDGHPHVVRERIEESNERIRDAGNACEVQGIEFGTWRFLEHDFRSGTVSFTRVLPSRLNQFVTVGKAVVQGKSVRLQVNYKHSWLPALRTLYLEPSLFVLEHIQARQHTSYEISSPEDLLADKILTVAGEYGRERFKDVYDLILLTRLDTDSGLVLEKLRVVAAAANLDPRHLLGAGVETVAQMASQGQAVRGLASMIGKSGKLLVNDWENQCQRVIRFLRDLQ